MRVEDLIRLAIATTALLGMAVAVGKAGLWLLRVLQKLARLTDDLAGEPPRAGMPEGRLGVLDRLVLIEEGQQQIREQLVPALAVVASLEQRLARLEQLQLAPSTTADPGPDHTAAA